MKKRQLVFFRFENVKKTKILDTTKCMAVGFLNIGINPSFLNRALPIPNQNPNNSYNVVWFPVNEGERDATRYEIFFNTIGGGSRAGNNCLVIYKELYTPENG